MNEIKEKKDSEQNKKRESISKKIALKVFRVLVPEDGPKTITEAFFPKNSSVFSKIITVILILSFIFFVFKPTKAHSQDFSKLNPKLTSVLGKIDKGNVSYFWDEPRYPEILQLPDDLLKSFVSKRRPTYARFDIDLLYSKMARDEDYTYTFSIDFEYDSKNFKECIATRDSNRNISLARTCREKLLTCLGKKEVSDVDANILSRCLDKNKECGVMKDLDKGSVVLIDYCEKLYGRKL